MNAARRAGTILGCAAVLTLAAGVPARASSVPPFQIVTSVHYGQAGNASGYSAVVALSPADAWVFGGTNPGGASSPTAEHWDGQRWRAAALPAGLGGFIVAADASSPDNVWAVGDGYALHWNGARWAVAKTFAGQVTSVVAVGLRGAWVFGPAGSGGGGTGAWHYDSRAWTRAAGPAAAIYRASAVSVRDIWAVATGPGGSTLLRYDGSDWDPVPGAAQALEGLQLSDVVALADDNVWVSGIATADGAAGRVVLAHWNGSTWTQSSAPWPAQQAERFAPDGSGGIWIPVVPAGASPQTWILHLAASGQWTRMVVATAPGSGVGVGDLALIPCTRSLWGAGGLVTTAGSGSAVILGGDTSELLVAHRPGTVTSEPGCAPGQTLPAPPQDRLHPAVPRYAAGPRSALAFPPGAA